MTSDAIENIDLTKRSDCVLVQAAMNKGFEMPPELRAALAAKVASALPAARAGEAVKDKRLLKRLVHLAQLLEVPT